MRAVAKLNWNSTRRLASFSLFAFFLTTIIGAIQAHGYLVRAIPADRAALQHAPTRLQYWFSEPLEARFSAIRLWDANGELLAEGGVSETDSQLLTLRVPPQLPDGAYVVELRPAFASDGHVVAESRVFTVGETSTNLEESAARQTAIPLESLWRWMTLLGTLVLFGTSSLYGAVLVPAWGNPRHVAGFLPPRVMARLSWIATLALLLAILGNLLALIQQTMAFFGADATRVLEDGLWRFVRIGTRFGDLWNPRLLLLALAALILLALWYYGRAGRHPLIAYPSWCSLSWLMALVLGSHSAASHAAGSVFWAWPAVLVDWVHLLAVAYWVGGLVALVLVLPAALRPLVGETRRETTLAVLRQFSRRLIPVVALVIATGVYSTTNHLTAVDDITETPYGQTLTLKLLLVASLLVLGAAQFLASRPNFAAPWSGHWRRLLALRAELIVAIVILASAASLSGTPIPIPENAGMGFAAWVDERTVGEYSISQSVSPTWTGINSLDTQITRIAGEQEGAAEDLKVQLRLAQPARDHRSDWATADAVAGGLYIHTSDALDQPGDWWLLLDIGDAAGQNTRVAFTLTVGESTTLTPTRRPTLLNGLALLGVAASLLWLFWPALRHQARLVDWRPANALVALGISAITIILIAIGYQALLNSGADYREQLNPTPSILNEQLPTQASLERGAALYQQHCLSWQASGRNFERLRDGADQLRDEELFFATRDGWRDLPSCSATLSANERWDIINYFRTLSKKDNSS